MTTQPVHDITGAEIRPGCLILYAAVSASSSYLYWGRVTGVKPGGTITFQGLDRWGTPKLLRDRLSTLHSPDKVVVLSWSRPIPDDIRRALDPEGKFAASLNQAAPEPVTGGLVG